MGFYTNVTINLDEIKDDIIEYAVDNLRMVTQSEVISLQDYDDFELIDELVRRGNLSYELLEIIDNNISDDIITHISLKKLLEIFHKIPTTEIEKILKKYE